jgi:hypothetical protein
MLKQCKEHRLQRSYHADFGHFDKDDLSRTPTGFNVDILLHLVKRGIDDLEADGIRDECVNCGIWIQVQVYTRIGRIVESRPSESFTVPYRR